MLGELVGGGTGVGERIGRGVDLESAPVVPADLPITVVDEVVAAGTELGKIGNVSRTVVLPVLNVMGLAPLRRRVAADAPTVSRGEHDPLGQRC